MNEIVPFRMHFIAALGAAFIIIGLLFMTYPVQAQEFTVDGERVYINDSKVYISAEPHTMTSSGYVDITLESKVFTGDINVVFGFDTDVTRPKSLELYKPTQVPVSKSYTCPDEDGIWFNYTVSPLHMWCWKTNSTGTHLVFEREFDSGNLAARTIYWTEYYTDYWKDISGEFNSYDVTFDGKDKWYVATDMPVTSGTTYNARMWVDVEPNKAGKYDVAFYPSSFGTNILAAIASNQFYYLDPWYNSSYVIRVNRTVSVTDMSANLTDFPLPVFVDTTTLISNDTLQSTCYDYIFVNETDDGQYAHELESNTCNNGTVALYWVNQDVSTVANISHDYFNSSTVTSNPSTTNTWDSDFIIVYHFNESAGNGDTIYDSTIYGNNATITGTASTNNDDYTLGRGMEVNASTSGAYVSDTAFMTLTDFTMEFWLRRKPMASSYSYIADKRKSAPFEYQILWDGTLNSCGEGGTNQTHSKIRFTFFDGGGGAQQRCSSSTIADDEALHYIVFVFDDSGNDFDIYIDGELDRSQSYTNSLNDRPDLLTLGYQPTDAQDSDTIFEDYRLSNVTRSADFIYATWQAVMNRTTVTTFGNIESLGGADVNSPSIEYTTPTPNDTTITNNDYIYINVTVSDDVAVDTCTLQWNGVNESMTKSGTETYCYINKTSLSDGSFTFKAFVNDTSDNIAAEDNRTVTVDATAPIANYTFGTKGAWIYQKPNGDMIQPDNDGLDGMVTWGGGSDTEHVRAYNVTSEFFASEGTASGFTEFIISGDLQDIIVQADLIPWLDIDVITSNGIENLSTIDLSVYVNDTWVAGSFTGYDNHTAMTLATTAVDFYSNQTTNNRTHIPIDITGYLTDSNSDGSILFALYSFEVYEDWYARVPSLGDQSHDEVNYLRYIVNGNRSEDFVFVNLTFNGTTTDLDTCTLEWDGVNESMTQGSGQEVYCWKNKTSLSDGSYNYKVFANDSAGNIVVLPTGEINIDTTDPTVSIQSPTNITYNTTTLLDINFTASDTNDIDSCWYTVDGGADQELAGCANTSVVFTSTFHTLRVYANDTFNNTANSEVNFTIQFTALTIYAWQEDSPSTSISNFSLVITDEVNTTLNENTTTGSIGFDLTNLTAGVEYSMTVSSTNYTSRVYYINLSNETGQVLNVYLLESADDVSVTFRVLDEISSEAEDALVTIQRFIGTEWTTVTQVYTDSSGTGAGALETGVTYKGIASKTGYDNHTKSFSLSASGETVTFQLGINDTVDYLLYLTGVIEAECTVLNSSTDRNISCTVTDNSGETVQTTGLLVRHVVGASWTEPCHDTTGSGFDVFCDIPMANATYPYILYITTSEGTFSLLSGTLDWSTVDVDYGNMGIFLTLILFLGLSWIAIFKIEAGILGGCIALIASQTLGFINIGLGSTIGIIAVGVIAFIMVMKR